ncbi:hypothetical protein V8C40DRAFT_285340 [Trichoderma camerunense]
MFKTKTWFLTALVFGCLFEFIGYAARAASASQEPGCWKLMPFIIQNMYILLGPPLFAASIYMILEYLHQAAQLQTRGLGHFNAVQPRVSDENCTAMFLFSSFLGLHTLFDTTIYQRDFTEFLDKFIQFIALHRGIRTVTRQSRHIINETEVKHIIDPISALGQLDPQLTVSCGECDGLLAHLAASIESLGPASFNPCCEAVKLLQWVIGRRRGLPDELHPHITMAWPVLVSFDYLQMLKQRRPEALVVLAHWAVLLYRDREFWVFGDTGRFMIESASKYLGTYW